MYNNLKWRERGHDEVEIANLINYKNETITSIIELVDVEFPQRIVVNNQIYARKSNIQNDFCSIRFQWRVPRNCPWLHHMSNNLLRFYEYHLRYVRLISKWQMDMAKIYIDNPINELTAKTNDETSATEMDDLGDLWLLIVIGDVLTLFVLLMEVFSSHV